MNKILRYSVNLFVHPRFALQSLLDDPKRIGLGFIGPAFLAVVYLIGISTALAMKVEHLPQFPILKIPPEQYYAFERFYILPVGIAGMILCAGAIQLAAHLWKGRGQFEYLFALLGFSLIVVAIVIGIPDLVLAILAGIGVSIPIGWVLSGPHIWLGTLWYFVLTIFAVKEVEHLSWSKTIMLSLIGFIVNGVVQFIFIR